ncbi:MAG: protein kinase, partial [Terriglobales bacterium]
MALASGTKLGPYDLQSLLGAGGMGEVYRARDARLDRIVAIKVLPATFSADTARLQRFMQEARSAAALNHPNILSIFDIGEERGAPYIVSELLEGQTLRERIR